jgi:hypothetical protein
MVAVMALMEATIIVGYFNSNVRQNKSQNVFGISDPTFFTNGSVLLILGSLIIGMLASDEQALGINLLRMIYSRDFSPYSFR